MEKTNEQEEIAFLTHKVLDLNKKLVESEKVKSRFLSLVANELNNPMTALLGLIPHLHATQQEIVPLIHQEALTLKFHVENLVSAAEIESGDVSIVYASLNPEEILKEVLADLRYTIQSRNIIVSTHNTLTKPVVSDPNKLYLILKNLIANGCIYGLVNGIVEVSFRKIGSILKIEVHNQGKGPKVEYKPQVFTRFAGGPEGNHGMGIGLSIVRELCERLDGSIDYTVSKKWVTFTVTLPVEGTVSELAACGSNEFMFESFNDAIEI